MEYIKTISILELVSLRTWADNELEFPEEESEFGTKKMILQKLVEKITMELDLRSIELLNESQN